VKEEPKLEAIGALFQQETKHDPERPGNYFLDWSRQPPPFKIYDKPIGRIALPNPQTAGDPNLWRALQKRRSRRDYRAGERLATGILSTLLWATQGATARWGDVLFRTAPSAGGLFPVETYVYAGAVENLDVGFYHYRPQAFDLEFLKRGDFSQALAHAALDQPMIAQAQATFIWSAVIARGRWKYRQRVYRYIYLDAGHIAQNLYLAAEALGLGVCAVGAFYDDLVNGLLDLDGTDETVIYMASVGLRAEAEGDR
jgi:SagB-type dehydrogenase family enzyme